MNIKITDKFSINLWYPSIQIERNEDKGTLRGRANLGLIQMFVPKSDRYYKATLNHEMVHIFQLWIMAIVSTLFVVFAVPPIKEFLDPIINYDLSMMQYRLVATILILTIILDGFKASRWIMYRMEVVAYAESIRSREDIRGNKFNTAELDSYLLMYAAVLTDPHGNYDIRVNESKCVEDIRKHYHKGFSIVNPLTWF